METNGKIGVGSRIGPNRIVDWLSTTDLGEFYKVFYGTTTHSYGFIVFDPEKTIDYEHAKNVIDELMSVTHPCLARPYATGFCDGVGWIRTELSNEPTVDHFKLPRNILAKLDETLKVSNARVLVDICGGVLPEPVFARIAGDLLEGLAELHSAGLVVGPFSLENILFQRDRNLEDDIISKWIGYGFGMIEKDALARSRVSESYADDVVSVGRVLRQMLYGEAEAGVRGVPEEWDEFFRKAECAYNGGFENAIEMFEAFSEISERRGLRHAKRKVPVQDVNIFEPPTAKDRESRHHRHHSSKLGYTRSGKTPLADRLKSFFKFIFVVGGIISLGLGGYWFASADVRSSRKTALSAKEFATTNSVPDPLVAVGNDTTPVWLYSRQEINLKHEGGDPQASMCLAFRIARGTDGEVCDIEKAKAIATQAYETLERGRVRAGDTVDGETLLWLGYAKLTGLGTTLDPVEGRKMLEDAASRNVYAQLILSDYLASGPVDRTEDNDRKALIGWQRVADALPQKSALSIACVEKVVDFVLAGRGLPAGNTEILVKWIDEKAQQRYLSAIIGYARMCGDGKLVEKNDFTAMNGYRSAALSGSAEGMRLMAWMFDKGTGVPQSDESAAVWFRRAAEAGDIESMKVVASLVERGTEDELPNPKLAAEWRARAKYEEEKKAGLKASYDAWWQMPEKSK